MQAITVPNVKAAMIAALQNRQLTITKLFAAVMKQLDVSPDDDENSDAVANTVTLLLDGQTFVPVTDENGNTTIAFRTIPPV